MCDQTIASESTYSYSDTELRQICSSRGMKVHSKTREQLLEQLNLWIDLSTNKKIPNALLILSNAAELIDTVESDLEPVELKMKSIIRTIYSFPGGVLQEAKMAIKEAAGTATVEERLTFIQEQEKFIEKELSDEESRIDKKEEINDGKNDDTQKDGQGGCSPKPQVINGSNPAITHKNGNATRLKL